MGVILMLGCYLVAFSPSLALFVRFVAPDPLRTILCVMGAFLWLVSLLVSSLAWLVISLITPSLAVTVGFSIVMQEAARVFYFWMLKKAQHGLNKITRPGSASVAPGVSDLHNARHMLALVCGLGMGVMAALFLTMNVFAEFAGPGTVGLPKALETGSRPANIGSEFLPLYYALSASMLTLFNVTWTIMVWDSCHHVGKHKVWPVPAVVALITHAAVSSLSSLNAEGKQVIVLVCQLVILLINIIYCQYIMGGTIVTMGKGGLDALVDWLTLAWIRARMTKPHNEYVVEELERRRDNTVST